MLERLWDFLVESCQVFFLPMICAYFSICGNLFLNSAVSDATGLEKVGDTLLIPVQYLLDGQCASQKEDGSWVYSQRFDYNHYFWVKTTASILAFPPSLLLGSAIKGLSLFSSTNRFSSASKDYSQTKINPNLSFYKELGISISDPSKTEWITPLGYQRHPGDEKHLEKDKLALKEVGALLTEANIPWWIDCGTCLGAYRYGGVIPWDTDIDIAVLSPDFENVRRALSKLDPKKYLVQNWSGRLRPRTYYKIYIKDTGIMIDVYHFAIDPKTQTLSYIFSQELNELFPKWWKVRERKFSVSTSFEVLFPLKRALFDGVEVFVPNDPVKYLQRYYGTNLEPTKLYNPLTHRYEKDETHPYWKEVLCQ